MEAAKRDALWVSDAPRANKGIWRVVATFALHSYPPCMLHIVRQHAQSLGIKIILGIIVAVFVLWGVEGVVSGVNSQATVAVIDGAPIEINTLARAEFNLRQAYERNFGDQLTPEILEQLDLPTRALEGLVQRRLLALEADNLGLEISDREVSDRVRMTPAFFSNGRFNKDTYVQSLRYSQLTPAEYESSIREDLAIARLQALVADEVGVSDSEVLAEITADQEKRTLEYASFRMLDFVEDVVVDEEALATWYGENEDRFEEPEKVVISFVAYRGEDFTDGIVLVEEDVAAVYDAGRETDFKQEQEVRARHILKRLAPDATDEQKQAVRTSVEALAASLAAGADFATLAQAESDDSGSAARGGDLGFFGKGRMVPAFEEAAFAVAPGSVSEIVETPFGLHLILVEEAREERTLGLEEVRPRIEADLREKEAAKKAAAAAKADRASLDEGKNLADIAQQRGLQLETPSPMARRDTLAGVGRAFPLMNALFALDEGEVTEVIETDGQQIVAALEEKIPARIPELAEVRPAVERAYKDAQATALAQTAADEFLAKVRAGESLDAVAQAEGVALANSQPFSRSEQFIQPMGGNRQMRDAAFALGPDGFLLEESFPIGGDVYVAAVSNREVPSGEALAEKVAATREQMTRSRREEVFQRYVDELRANAVVEIYNDRLDVLRRQS